jgi:hypothetical protein
MSETSTNGAGSAVESAANGSDGPGGVALIDHDTFEVTGA